MESILKNNRIVYIDILRIISILAVVVLHITADLLTRTNDFNTSSWWVSNILNSVSRFAVPVFFMISGAMILHIEIRTYKDFYLKRILPFTISLISWSFIYGFYNQYYLQNSKMGVYEFLGNFAYRLFTTGNYVHLWFLYAIIAIYMTVPLISKWVRMSSEKDLRYFLILWFVISIVYRFVSDITFRVTGEYISVPVLDIPLCTGFLGYFILGYYLFTYDLPEKLKYILFNLGIVSFFLTPVMTYFASLYNGILDEMFYGNYSVTTFFMAVGTFIYFKEKEANISRKFNYKIKKMISSVSKASFSIYLIHLLVDLLVSRKVKAEGTILETSFTLIFNTAVIFSISYIIVKILNLNKFLTKVLFGGRG